MMKITVRTMMGTPDTHCQKSRHHMNLITPANTIFLKKNLPHCSRETTGMQTAVQVSKKISQIPAPCSFNQVIS